MSKYDYWEKQEDMLVKEFEAGRMTRLEFDREMRELQAAMRDEDRDNGHWRGDRW